MLRIYIKKKIFDNAFIKKKFILKILLKNNIIFYNIRIHLV